MNSINHNFPLQSFDALLNATVDAIIVINGDGIIEVFNKMAEEVFGYSSSEVIGQKINLLMPEPYRSEHDAYLENYHNTHNAKIIGIGREVTALRKDGTTFPIDLAVGKIKDTQNPRYVGIIRDITERKRIETQLRIQDEELHQQRERLAHVSRIGTMGEMATGIAHEINQPLTAITTYAQACRMLIESGNSQQSELIETLEKISAQAERAGEVIRRLRSFLKKSDRIREASDIHELIKESVKMAEIDSRLANIGLELDFSNTIDLLKIDPIQIQQVLLNLIRNGIDAMQSKPPVDKRLKRFIKISTQQIEKGKSVKITVCDQGPGLDQQTAEQIFDPFFTTKTQGMGMGLAICRSIIQEHGGKMGYENNPDQAGTCFFFTLPTMIKE